MDANSSSNMAKPRRAGERTDTEGSMCAASNTKIVKASRETPSTNTALPSHPKLCEKSDGSTAPKLEISRTDPSCAGDRSSGKGSKWGLPDAESDGSIRAHPQTEAAKPGRAKLCKDIKLSN